MISIGSGLGATHGNKETYTQAGHRDPALRIQKNFKSGTHNHSAGFWESSWWSQTNQVKNIPP